MCGAIATECTVKECTNMVRMDIICWRCKEVEEE
jgi:hypothetical protein